MTGPVSGQARSCASRRFVRNGASAHKPYSSNCGCSRKAGQILLDFAGDGRMCNPPAQQELTEP